jgi:hypothetical protein
LLVSRAIKWVRSFYLEPGLPDTLLLESPVVLENGGDTTVRPCSSEVKAFLEAQREHLRRWQIANGQDLENGPALAKG